MELKEEKKVKVVISRRVILGPGKTADRGDTVTVKLGFANELEANKQAVQDKDEMAELLATVKKEKEAAAKAEKEAAKK